MTLSAVQTSNQNLGNDKLAELTAIITARVETVRRGRDLVVNNPKKSNSRDRLETAFVILDEYKQTAEMATANQRTARETGPAEELELQLADQLVLICTRKNGRERAAATFAAKETLRQLTLRDAEYFKLYEMVFAAAKRYQNRFPGVVYKAG